MRKTFVAFVMLAFWTAPAAASELTVTFGGAFYDGPPQYEILVDGEKITTGAVAGEHGDVVAVEVGDPTSLAIRFINDLAGPKGPDGKRPKGTDRNLIIEAVEFRGQRLLGKELVVSGAGVSKAGEFAVVAVNQTVDIPMPLFAGAAAKPAKPTCKSMDVQLTGFENGELLPSADVLAKLDDLLTGRGCSVIVTGYSSISGSPESNKQASLKRAQAVLDYMINKGAAFVAVDVAGWGETELFGADEAANRRVVVSTW